MKTKLSLLSMLIVVALLSSCTNFKKISYARDSAFKKKPVKEKIDRYDIYVHQDETTYRIEEPLISENVLSGKPVKMAKDEKITGDSLNDMHIFVNEDVLIFTDTNQVQSFTRDNVKNVEMYGTKSNAGAGIALGILLALLLIPVILVIAVVVLVTDSGSDSGGSNSGGSDSGCYIATLSYGSYDAPQVLVLREFRDRFLQKFGAGRAFIAWYYKHSPSFVEKHRSKKWLHSTLRLPLNALVFVLKPFYSGKNAEK